VARGPDRAARGRAAGAAALAFRIRPRSAIALAYAAAVVVMLPASTPRTSPARRASAGSGRPPASRSRWPATRSPTALGALQEKTLREALGWKGRAAGYGRAAISDRDGPRHETESKPPSRPRSGEDKGVLNGNEIEIIAWRAEPPPGRS
jgi:hypothetical protein